MTNQECINKEFRNNVFSDIEKTGEQLKEQIKGFETIIKKKIDAQINCAKFEASYGFSTSKRDRIKTMKEVKEVRQELWNDALKRAKGDTKLAYSFYKDICSFP